MRYMWCIKLGAIAVHDDDVIRYIDFAAHFMREINLYMRFKSLIQTNKIGYCQENR